MAAEQSAKDTVPAIVLASFVAEGLWTAILWPRQSELDAAERQSSGSTKIYKHSA